MRVRITGDRQAEIVYQLKLLLPKGGVLTECGVSTQGGNKTPDISWISVHHPQFRRPDVKVLNPAPEICVEVLSPSNSADEIELKNASTLKKRRRKLDLWFGRTDEIFIAGS